MLASHTHNRRLVQVTMNHHANPTDTGPPRHPPAAEWHFPAFSSAQYLDNAKE